MENSPVVSNQKIIMFVMFVFMAIMTSVMVYNFRIAAQTKATHSDEVLLFPQPREIKPFELLTQDNQRFSQDNLKDHWTLMFFGFTHCASVCPTTLAMIGKTYAALQQAYPTLQVVLVSLDPQRDTPDLVSHYARSFDNNFIGITGKLDEVRKLQSQLGVFSGVDPATEQSGAYQLQHTASIMLINPQGQWAGMFKFGMKPETFEKVFIETVKG
jgi:protein SCO1/2